MSVMDHLSKMAEHAQVATYGGAAGTLAFWGLHINEVCAVISTAVAVIGLGLQLFGLWRRHRLRHHH